MNTENKILVVSSAGFVLLILAAILFSGDFVLSTNLVLLAIVFVTVPYSLYKFLEYRRIREFEKTFPLFLRDLAESQRAGLTLIQSIHIVARSDYGSLSREIRKLDNQVSWNVPLDKALKSFSDRVGSHIIRRSLMVIRQSYKSGGKIEESMEALAGNIEMLREVQAEKSTLLNQQVMLMYAIFFIFLGISITLVKFLSPLLQTQTAFELINAGSSNPCQPCIGSSDFTCVGCAAFGTVSVAFGFGEPSQPESYYRSLFFTMLVLQAIFSGLISGQIASDSLSAGVRHSMIMLVSGIFVFVGAVRIGFI